MIRRTVFVAILLAACWAARAQTVPAIGLFLRFDYKPSTVFVKAMEGELKVIFLPAHVRLRWFLPAENSGDEIWLGKMTLLFHGRCAAIPDGDDLEGISRHDGTLTLADTVLEHGAVLPYAETNCDTLRVFLATEDPRPPGEETRLGIAMARLLAHELYHFLLQTRAHSATGVAKAIHTPAALLGQSLRFEHGELERILSLHADVADPSAPGPPSVSALTQKTSLRAN